MVCPGGVRPPGLVDTDDGGENDEGGAVEEGAAEGLGCGEAAADGDGDRERPACAPGWEELAAPLARSGVQDRP